MRLYDQTLGEADDEQAERLRSKLKFMRQSQSSFQLPGQKRPFPHSSIDERLKKMKAQRMRDKATPEARSVRRPGLAESDAEEERRRERLKRLMKQRLQQNLRGGGYHSKEDWREKKTAGGYPKMLRKGKRGYEKEMPAKSPKPRDKRPARGIPDKDLSPSQAERFIQQRRDPQLETPRGKPWPLRDPIKVKTPPPGGWKGRAEKRRADLEAQGKEFPKPGLWDKGPRDRPRRSGYLFKGGKQYRSDL